MKLVFDMDNTLSDDFGNKLRPGIKPLLERLKKEGHSLILWTNSGRARAIEILKRNELYEFFDTRIYREDYDPENKKLMKDISLIQADILIDDDPAEIAFNQKNKQKAILVKAYRGKEVETDEEETLKIYKAIQKVNKPFWLF
ncbi:MAG: hypothetical protein H7A25_13535 [Leptospiraceae bacterium]|nr:hypothetical protein [Leptospiraceae bacterium]MCP5500924.1 hypothetical protein [Leptospiraceae bacterium]